MEQIIQKVFVSKAKASADGVLDFVLSDATVDRYGDTIDPNGWVLDTFFKNPIALFNHSSNFPIGKWSNLRVEDNALRGNLTMAPKGASERIDELRALIDAGILRAVSVGFMPLDSRARKDAHGYYIGEEYVKQELVETSLVSIPANPNAVLAAKGMNISKGTMDMIFGEQATEDQSFVIWRGNKIPVKRHVYGTWRDQTLYRAE